MRCRTMPLLDTTVGPQRHDR